MTAFAKTQISISGFTGKGADRKAVRMFITGITWAQGDGFKMAGFDFSKDQTKGHLFGQSAAAAVSETLARRYNDVRLHQGATETVVVNKFAASDKADREAFLDAAHQANDRVAQPLLAIIANLDNRMAALHQAAINIKAQHATGAVR